MSNFSFLTYTHSVTKSRWRRLLSNWRGYQGEHCRGSREGRHKNHEPEIEKNLTRKVGICVSQLFSGVKTVCNHEWMSR